MLEKTDAQLITKALQVDKRAGLNLLKHYEKHSYNQCMRMAGKNVDALDLMQQAFISVFRNFSFVRHQGRLKCLVSYRAFSLHRILSV